MTSFYFEILVNVWLESALLFNSFFFLLFKFFKSIQRFFSVKYLWIFNVGENVLSIWVLRISWASWLLFKAFDLSMVLLSLLQSYFCHFSHLKFHHILIKSFMCSHCHKVIHFRKKRTFLAFLNVLLMSSYFCLKVLLALIIHQSFIMLLRSMWWKLWDCIHWLRWFHVRKFLISKEHFWSFQISLAKLLFNFSWIVGIRSFKSWFRTLGELRLWIPSRAFH